MSSPRTLTFFTRDGCGLCDEALEIVERVRRRVCVDLVVVDLDREASPEKRRAYDWDVPVLELDGRKIAKVRFDEARLLRLLGASGPG